MRTLFCCVCLALCLSCSEALAPNQGTGKNCNTASDAPGGPKCTGSQIGVCCGASVDSDNCLRVLGATAANTDNKPPAGSLPSCATLLGPNRYRHSAATKWMRQVVITARPQMTVLYVRSFSNARCVLSLGTSEQRACCAKAFMNAS
ncbi:TPA: hypothetical protein ACH3X3_002013 [Trebouxia sp. C0006]